MTDQDACIFGIPMDLGQNRRGVDMGPSAVRVAGLQERLARIGYAVCDQGNLAVVQAEQQAATDPVTDSALDGRAQYLPQVADTCARIYDWLRAELTPTMRGIFLGGDHSLSIGTVAAVASRKAAGQDTGTCGVLWVDAHPDMNTPQTSPSGNVHGMALAALLGHGPVALTEIGGPGAALQPGQVALLGLRDVDASERALVRASGAAVYTMRDIDERSLSAVAHEILLRFASFPRIHVSLDLDACDPTVAPGVGTPVMGGLRYREVHLLMEMLADSGKVRTVDVVEINPILDDRNHTSEVAVEFIASLFGQRIL